MNGDGYAFLGLKRLKITFRYSNIPQKNKPLQLCGDLAYNL